MMGGNTVCPQMGLRRWSKGMPGQRSFVAAWRKCLAQESERKSDFSADLERISR